MYTHVVYLHNDDQITNVSLGLMNFIFHVKKEKGELFNSLLRQVFSLHVCYQFLGQTRELQNKDAIKSMGRLVQCVIYFPCLSHLDRDYHNYRLCL